MTRTIAALAFLLVSCAVPPPGVQEQGPPLELAGLAAGPPERCVQINSQQSLRLSDTNRSVLLYGDSRTTWANNLGQCRFRADDILVTEPFGSQYCRGDVVRSVDRQSRIPGPTCILGDFVPYRRR
jgi:hypothetical protein